MSELREGHVKRTFKCDSCANVTQRIRITDDTPVRGIRAPEAEPMDLDQTFPHRAQLFALDEMVEKVSSVIMTKLNAFELSIKQEIKIAVAVLATENNKLRQELREANMKCISYEQEINRLETEKLIISEKVGNLNTGNSTPSPICTKATTTPTCATNTVSSSYTSSINTQAPAQPSAAGTSYAAVARKTADRTGGDIKTSDWIEVKSKNQRKPVLRGGNNTIATIKAVERKKFLHVWRLEKSTTEVELKEYIKKTLGNDCEIIVEKLKTKTAQD